MSSELRNFLSLPYDELEELNLQAKEQRKNRVAAHKMQEERLKYLTDEKRIKAVTVLFSDLEGRLHMLDYDKKFLIKSWDNLTFDGSSIRGFTAQRESDLRLGIDWARSTGARPISSAPARCWSSAKSSTRTARPTRADMRGVLKAYADKHVQEERLHPERRQRNRGLPLQGRRRRAPLPRDRQVRIRQHRRLLPLAARRPAAHVHRHRRRSAARHGLPEREGPSRSRALAVRNQLRLRRSRRRRRPDPALQADLPPGRHPHGPDRLLSCPSRSSA